MIAAGIRTCGRTCPDRFDAGGRLTTLNLPYHRKSDSLHATLTGPNPKADLRQSVDGIVRECVSRDCWRVLIEERLDGPGPGTKDVLEIMSEESAELLGKFRSIAFVDANAADSPAHASETVPAPSKPTGP